MGKSANVPSRGSQPSRKMMENARATAIGYKRGSSSGPSSGSGTETASIGSRGGPPEQSFAGWGGRYRDAHVQSEGSGYLKPRTISRGSIGVAPSVDASMARPQTISRAVDMTRSGAGTSLSKMNKMLRLNRMF